ncbi:hypothetical protein BKA66DRAFT_128719 [Pyrenochaeta sp. MPI-SDFR-AT-0127]|nr:hypothetical protein BKA66DRAFT_128719 [Pyrenochaeta sp. MPI-SDFR-AT-0127]
MATVTIGKSYFESLVRRTDFRTCGRGLNVGADLSNNVTISKAEHEYLLEALREYNLLKNALLRGGLPKEALASLLGNDNGSDDHPSESDYRSGETSTKPNAAVATVSGRSLNEILPVPDNIALCDGLQPMAHLHAFRHVSYGESESHMDNPSKEHKGYNPALSQRFPVSDSDRRTILISNLSKHTTHRDLVGVVRGGRLLEIILRSDRTATISFFEGATEFLTHARRNDIYLHMKRLELRWSDRQFYVPPHVSNKIRNGATRNLVVRGIAGKLTADQIRDHLDHIHNLVVVDIYFKNDDAYISTNAVHHALIARTCMKSRTKYKGTRIEYYPDECAALLPRLAPKVPAAIPHDSTKPMPISNQYAVLSNGSSYSSDSENDMSMTNGVRIDSRPWADTATA